MKKIVAIIEKGQDGGYAIYAADETIPVVADGLSEEETRKTFSNNLHEQALYIKEKTGMLPKWYDKKMEVEYRYDMSAFFLSFPFINATELARALGLNPSLLRKYKNGLAKASEKQKNMIQEEFDKIVNRLTLVKF